MNLLHGVQVPDAHSAVAGGGGDVAAEAIDAEAKHRLGVRAHQRAVTTTTHVQVAKAARAGGSQDLQAVV